jgi:predicted nuclease of restriction endonuclease-like (RecB) superfamily
MIAFYREYPDLFLIVPPPVAQLPSAKVQQPVAQIAADLARALIVPQPAAQLDLATPASSILQQAAAKLPWAHHLILLEKVKNLADRLWYMQAAVEHGWSRSVLTVQIEQRAHTRAGRAVTNFAATLPPPQSDLAQQTLKDPYLFDFLTLGPAARERDLEQGLIDHVQHFLVALGTGFAFVGRQVRLAVAA